MDDGQRCCFWCSEWTKNIVLHCRVQSEIDQVKDIMVANIDVIIERGEKLELLVDKTEHLATNSVTFRFWISFEKKLLTFFFAQEYLKKPSACHMVEKHETDHWSGLRGSPLPLCRGVSSMWGARLVEMCGLITRD